jgi:hypothetical protein
MTVGLELARRQWEEGHRRFEVDARDPAQSERLEAAFEAISDELRKRVGQTFTLGELALAYERADDWSRDAVAARAPLPGWPRTVTMVQDAAFHRYARGATDYRP